MHSNDMPTWLKVLLAVVAVVVLGPPALALLAWALALTFALGVLAVKVAVVVALVLGAIALFKAIFGGSPRQTLVAPPPTRSSGIEDLEAQVAAEERARRAALDRELEAALQKAG
jgi:hypothetical protein